MFLAINALRAKGIQRGFSSMFRCPRLTRAFGSRNAKTIVVAQDDQGMRLDRWLRMKFMFDDGRRITQSWIEKALRKRQVTVLGSCSRPVASKRVNPGESVVVPSSLISVPDMTFPKGSSSTAGDHQLSLIFEDDDFLVVNKPCGVASQGGTGVANDAHVDFLMHSLGERTHPSADCYRLVHRLDKFVTGVMVIAKSRAMASTFGYMFRNNLPWKTYLALLDQDVP